MLIIVKMIVQFPKSFEDAHGGCHLVPTRLALTFLETTKYRVGSGYYWLVPTEGNSAKTLFLMLQDDPAARSTHQEYGISGIRYNLRKARNQEYVFLELNSKQHTDSYHSFMTFPGKNLLLLKAKSCSQFYSQYMLMLSKQLPYRSI